MEYLQRQMAMLARHNGLAIVIQAALFGIGHAYEGVNSVVTICLQAIVFGLFAFWRGNIRAGILAHAGWDVLAGFGLI